jgi:drug/metabolite transporter (DMT)-like permease
MNATRRGMLCMIVFALLWALVEAFAGWLSRPYSPYQVVWARYGSHLAIMLAIWGWRDPLVLVRTRRPTLQIARSLLMLIMPAAWILSLQRGLTPDTVLAIFGVAPLIICALAALLLKERPTPGIWISAAVVSAGAMFCLSLHALPSLTAVAAALTSTSSFSLYVVMTRMLRGESLRANLFYTALGVFAALSLFVPKVWVMPTPHDALVMVLIGALGLLALLALDRTAQTAPVSSGGAMVDTRLLLLTGGMVVGRHPDLHIAIGVATIAIGTICALSLGRNPVASAQ